MSDEDFEDEWWDDEDDDDPPPPPRRVSSGGRTPLRTGELLVRYPQLRNPPVPPREHRPHLDRQLERLILRCLAPKPCDRFQTVSGLLAALSPHLKGRYRLWPEGAPIERRADTRSR